MSLFDKINSFSREMGRNEKHNVIIHHEQILLLYLNIMNINTVYHVVSLLSLSLVLLTGK